MMNEAEGMMLLDVCCLVRGQQVRFFGKRTDQSMYLILLPITTQARKYWIVKGLRRRHLKCCREEDEATVTADGGDRSAP